MRVLFLDDDRIYLDMLKTYLSNTQEHPFAERGVETTFTTQFAYVLNLLQSESIDLLVTDFDMPENDGLQVLEVLRDVFPHVKTAIATCHVEESYRRACWESIDRLPQMRIAGYEAYRKACLRAGASIYLAKPATLEEIDMFLKRLVELLPEPRSEEDSQEDTRSHVDGFTGMVRKASLFDIIQMLCLSSGDFTLEIRSFTRQGNIYINQGQVVHCESEGLEGRDAVFALLADRSGEFDMKPGTPQVERTIFESWDSLVLEAAKSEDEVHKHN
jgi:CheY-like chemotaxis protein